MRALALCLALWAVGDAGQAEPVTIDPPSDPIAWIGEHPARLIGSPDWTATFEALMGSAALAEARARMRVASPMTREGDWVVGRACRPHACPLAFGAVALSVPGGRPLVALWAEGSPPRLWGDPRGTVPPTVLGVLAGRGP